MKHRSFQTSRNVSAFCVFLVVLSVIFVIHRKLNKDKCKCPKGKEPGLMVADQEKTVSLDDTIWKTSETPNVSLIRSVMGPLLVQYTYLLGSPPIKKSEHRILDHWNFFCPQRKGRLFVENHWIHF
ncbi:hypothetical protein JRQ81_000430 [Phrynocephalus forsythii]|uniref:Uncharacterized protein n=1 Tax=Phrynocephalus forsythii TaxID=171643 RepID=A0A9Q0Y592_9SAUR|nr:hypothetical protein JRQ81_000430 [Phrynocephalus forsythii]